MLSPLLRPRLCRFFCPLDTYSAPALNSRSRIVRLPASTLGKRMLGTSTENASIYTDRHHVLRTLRPERLSIVGQEIADLSGKSQPGLSTPVEPHPLKCLYEWVYRDTLMYLPFPENTRGFFYYHKPPDGPELAAGVRFRICNSAAEFEQGRDLLATRGEVWCCRLLDLVKHKEHVRFLSLLRAEKQVDEALIEDINKLDITRNVRRYYTSLSDPFYLNVAKGKTKMTYVTRQKLVGLVFPLTVFKVRKTNSYMRPLTGTIKVQFELSDLPEHKALGPTLVIRVLDIVEPITVDPLYKGTAVPVPVPGTLLYRHAFKQSRKHIVCIPLKKQKMDADLLELAKAAGRDDGCD